MNLEGKKLVVVSGKGGVGKSVVAASLALSESLKGKKVLLVGLGQSTQYSLWFNKGVGHEPTPLGPNLSVALWEGDSCLREYIRHLVKVARIADLFFDNPVMRSFVKAAPGLRELAIMGKFTSGIRSWGPPLDYDLIVLDAFATGHYLALLRAPLGMAQLISVGPMGEQSRKIHEVLVDSSITEHVLVTLPEVMPVSETLELNQSLRSEFGIYPKIVCNKFIETHLTSEKLDSIIESGLGAEQDFLHFLRAHLARQEETLEKIGLLDEAPEILPLIYSAQASEVVSQLKDRLGRG